MINNIEYIKNKVEILEYNLHKSKTPESDIRRIQVLSETAIRIMEGRKNE